MSAASSHKTTGLTLAMCGCEERLQLVLGKPATDGYSLLASREWTVPGQSIGFLTHGLKETLDRFGIGMEAVDRIACVHGPGSFTGLRLILAAAEGLAAGRNTPLAGIDYLHLLASGPAPLLSGVLHVLTYARRGLVYLQSFMAPTLEELFPLTSLTVAEAADTMGTQSNTAFLMGSGIHKNATFFSELATMAPGYTLLGSQWDNASPQLLLNAALDATYTAGPLEPVYVRATDAEDNLGHFAQKRGLDPDAARKRLDELQRT